MDYEILLSWCTLQQRLLQHHYEEGDCNVLGQECLRGAALGPRVPHHPLQQPVDVVLVQLGPCEETQPQTDLGNADFSGRVLGPSCLLLKT